MDFKDNIKISMKQTTQLKHLKYNIKINMKQTTQQKHDPKKSNF